MEIGDTMPTRRNYTGDLTHRALTGTMHNKNIKCQYRKPKQAWEIQEQAPNYKSLSVDELKALIPQNWFDDTSNSYWEENLQTFWGKDGQSNAYVKSGLDDEIMESGQYDHLLSDGDGEHRIRYLETAINGLSADQKQCIELFYLSQKSYNEVEQITGYTFNEVKSHLQNGKRNLKLMMERMERYE